MLGAVSRAVLMTVSIASALLDGGVNLASAAGGITERVSVADDGTEGNNSSFNAATSAHGRFVAFSSLASNLVPGDANGLRDVFLRDRLLGTTELISLAHDGMQANGDSDFPSISADGRFVAFRSFATNLVPEGMAAPFEVFVRDRLLWTIERLSIAPDGTDFPFDSPALSADGRFVAFRVVSPGESQIFVRDRLLATTELVSLGLDGNPGPGGSFDPAISADGRFVAFGSFASNLVVNDTNDVCIFDPDFPPRNCMDVFVRDRLLGSTKLISISSDGTQGDNDSLRPAISADGRFVAFESFATTLAPGDVLSCFGPCVDIFVRDQLLGITERVSVSLETTEGNSNSHFAAISADGRFVAFESGASNLVSGITGFHVFVRDRAVRITELVSQASDGSPGGFSFRPAINGDGRFVAFHSEAGNLAVDDTNGAVDIFIRDRGEIVPPPPPPRLEYTLTGGRLAFFVGDVWQITGGCMVWQLFAVLPKDDLEVAVFEVEGFSIETTDSLGTAHTVTVVPDDLPSPFFSRGIPGFEPDSGWVDVFSNGVIDTLIHGLSIDGQLVDQRDRLGGPALIGSSWTGSFPEPSSFSIRTTASLPSLGLFLGNTLSLTGELRPCAQPPADSDGDGVPDAQDACPDTPTGKPRDADGCYRDFSITFDRSIIPEQRVNTEAVPYVVADVRNLGQLPGEATASMTLPPQLTIEDFGAGEAICLASADRVVTCHLGSLQPGESRAVVVQSVTACVPVDLHVEVSSAVQATPDLIPQNNTDVISFEVVGDQPDKPLCQQKLVERFRPILFIANGTLCDEDIRQKLDPYDPIEVQIMLNDPPARTNDSTRLRVDNQVDPQPDTTLLERRPPTVLDLASNPGPDNYIDIKGLSPRNDEACANYASLYESLRGQYRRVAYATIEEIGPADLSCENEKLRVTYWFFYYFNDWRNRHEGDWEHIVLFFDRPSVPDIVNQSRTPANAVYAQHGHEISCRAWDDVRKEGTQPKVYVATGSHASYFEPGRHRVLVRFVDFAQDESTATRVEPAVVLIPTSCSDPRASDSALAWVKFLGQWGQELDFDDRLRLRPDDTWSGGFFSGHCR